MADRVPENALLSHDLFEGIFARAGLVTDIELFDEFPSHYLEARRPPAPLGAGRLAAAAVDPRPRARRRRARRRPPHPGDRALEDDRQPAPDGVSRRSPSPPWRGLAGPDRSRRVAWTGLRRRVDRAARADPGVRRAAAAAAGHLQAEPPAGRRRRHRPRRRPRRARPGVPGRPGVVDGRRHRARADPPGRHPPPASSNGRRPRRPRPTPTGGSRASTAGWPAASASRSRSAVAVLAVAARVRLAGGAVRRAVAGRARSSPAWSAGRRPGPAGPRWRAADAQALRLIGRRTWRFFETFVGPEDHDLPPGQLPGSSPGPSSPTGPPRPTSGCTCSPP